MSNDIQQQRDTQSRSVTKRQKIVLEEREALAYEEAHMRKITFYFVIGFCSCAELASFAAFFLAKSVEGAILFQLPALVLFYHVFCFLYPSKGTTTNAFVALIQTFLKHKTP